MRILGCIVCLFLAVHCASKVPVRLGPPSHPVQAKEYRDVLSTWTKSDKIYHFLDNRLFVTATFHSIHFKRAFAAAFPHLYGHGGVLTRKELAEDKNTDEGFLGFLMVTYTPFEKWNDFSASDSIWNMELQTSEGVALHPSQVVPVKIDANIRAVYPHIERFERVYLVHFPVYTPDHTQVLGPETTHFSLVMASALGKAVLRWDLTP